MRTLIRFAVTTLVALAASIVALDSSSIAKSPNIWQPPTGVVIAAVVILGLSVVWGYVDSELERRRQKRRYTIVGEVSRLTFPVWRKLQSSVGDPKIADRLGLHVWMAPTWYWNVVPPNIRQLVPPSWRGSWRTPQLWRAIRIRMKDGHEPTQISWRRDIGATGRAWRTGQACYVNIQDEWGSAPLSPEQWSVLSQEAQLGLTYQQHVVLSNKYAQVLAVPILEDPDQAGTRFIGCVVIDALKDYPTDVNTRRIRSNAFKLAHEISNAMKAL